MDISCISYILVTTLFFHGECDQSGARVAVSFHKSSSRNWHPADLNLTQMIVKQYYSLCQFENQE